MALPAPLPAPPPRPRAGFVVYVTVPDETSPADLAAAAEALHELAVDALPGAETITALSLAPGASDEVRRVGERLTTLRLVGSED